MASAENQGKTIALVITIVLFVAASATAFYFFNQVATYDSQRAEAAKKAQESESNLRKEQQSYAELRSVLEGKTGTSGDHAAFVEEAKKKLVNPNREPPRKKKDVGNRAGAFSHFFEAVDLINRYLKVTDDEVAAYEDNLGKQTDQLAKVAKTYDSKVETANEATTKKAAELREQTEIQAKTREELSLSADAAQLRFQKKAQDYDQLKRNTESEIDDLKNQITKITLLMERARQQQIRGHDVRFNLEDGQIVQVQGGGAEAYINVGRADGATEGLTFGIYGIDRSGFTKNLPKANVEIIRILGDKRSLARVLDYQISDPVVPGDKIFNPIWDQGRKTGVAILGIVDMDGDGVADNDEFKHLVTRWGGKVDAEVDLKTYKMVGRITTETDWLVEGKIPEPSESGDVEAAETQNIRNAILAATSKFRKEAQVNGVRPVNVHNFLAYMGYRPVRKTQGLGEEDIYRQTIRDQAARRIQPNPGDVSETEDAIDVERVKRDLRPKDKKKPDAGATKAPSKKKGDEESGEMDEGTKGKKDDAKKEDSGKKKTKKKEDDDF